MRVALALLALALLALAGCGASWKTPPVTDPLDQTLESAEAQVRAGAYAPAIRNLEEFVKVHPTAAAHDRALYGLARTMVLADPNGKGYRQAQVYFDRLLREHPHSAYVPDAKAWRAVLAAYIDRTKELDRLKKELDRLKKIDMELERRNRR